MNITCSNEIDTARCAITAFKSFEVPYDALGDIRREDSRKAQARKSARKQRARELTKKRELEIKKAKGETK